MWRTCIRDKYYFIMAKYFAILSSSACCCRVARHKHPYTVIIIIILRTWETGTRRDTRTSTHTSARDRTGPVAGCSILRPRDDWRARSRRDALFREYARRRANARAAERVCVCDTSRAAAAATHDRGRGGGQQVLFDRPHIRICEYRPP